MMKVFFIYILFDLWLCLFWLSVNMHNTWRMLWTAWNLRYVIWLLALMFKISILLLRPWQMISNWLDGKMCNFEGYFISTEIIIYDTAVILVKCISFSEEKDCWAKNKVSSLFIIIYIFHWEVRKSHYVGN